MLYLHQKTSENVEPVCSLRMQIPYAELIALMALSEFCATKSYCQTLLTSLHQVADHLYRDLQVCAGAPLLPGGDLGPEEDIPESDPCDHIPFAGPCIKLRSLLQEPLLQLSRLGHSPNFTSLHQHQHFAYIPECSKRLHEFFYDFTDFYADISQPWSRGVHWRLHLTNPFRLLQYFCLGSSFIVVPFCYGSIYRSVD